MLIQAFVVVGKPAIVYAGTWLVGFEELEIIIAYSVWIGIAYVAAIFSRLSDAVWLVNGYIVSIIVLIVYIFYEMGHANDDTYVTSTKMTVEFSYD